MGKVKYPKRRVILTFTHDACGDARFAPMVDAAYSERLCAIGREEISDTSDFSASNGVLIRVSGYQVADGIFDWWPLSGVEMFIRRKIREMRGLKDIAYLSEDGMRMVFVLGNEKSAPESFVGDGVKYTMTKKRQTAGPHQICPPKHT